MCGGASVLGAGRESGGQNSGAHEGVPDFRPPRAHLEAPRSHVRSERGVEAVGGTGLRLICGCSGPASPAPPAPWPD